MRLRPLECFGFDLPVPFASGEPIDQLGPDLAVVRFDLPVAAHAAYVEAVEAWARVSRFRRVARRDAGTAHLRRYERGEWRVVLHLGVDPTSAVLVVASSNAPRRHFEAASWESTLEASTDREVAVLEATCHFGEHASAAARAIEHRLGLPPPPSLASQRLAEPAAIVEGTLRDKSRLQLPSGSEEAVVVAVEGARHYTIRSTARLSAASLRKHYRAWAKAKGYDILVDLYDGEILELALRRRTRGLIISWARGESHTTVQVGPGRQVFARHA